MKLIIIFGPQAVGKMTVGQELEKITGLKLFHNHATMEAISNIFPITSDANRRLKTKFRLEIFKEVVKSDLEGLIFTYLWRLEEDHNAKFINQLTNIFENANWEVYFVELAADQKERLERNKTENRLKHKPSKKDLVKSEESLVYFDKTYKMNTEKGEGFEDKNYVKINNTKLSPQEVAEKIKKEFKL